MSLTTNWCESFNFKGERPLSYFLPYSIYSFHLHPLLSPVFLFHSIKQRKEVENNSNRRYFDVLVTHIKITTKSYLMVAALPKQSILPSSVTTENFVRHV
jgi:hypothetical protein